MPGSAGWTGWAELIAPDHWATYERVLERLVRQRVRFALGGAFASATHTGRWRDTNDLDFYILPGDRERVTNLVEEAGLKDIQSQCPYGCDWTYRATDGNVIVEAIWCMRNHRAEVDREWLERANEISVRNLRLQVAAPEEMIWPKLYVVMRERCDWPDILNYFYYCGDRLDWQHLLERLGEDAPLLGAALCLFSWVSPDRISTIPEWVWQRAGIKVPHVTPPADGGQRARLLSASDWYGPVAARPVLEKSK